MDYMRAREIMTEHRPPAFRWLRRNPLCRACRCGWKCPSRLAAETTLAVASTIVEPAEWRFGFGDKRPPD